MMSENCRRKGNMSYKVTKRSVHTTKLMLDGRYDLFLSLTISTVYSLETVSLAVFTTKILSLFWSILFGSQAARTCRFTFQDMQHDGQAEWTCSKAMQHGHAGWTGNKDMQNGHAAWK